MSERHPQVFEPHLDEMLAGRMVERPGMESMLRNLLTVRRRYNDPYQSGQPFWSDGSLQADPRTKPPSTHVGCLGGITFSHVWTIESQKARVEQGIAFLTPIVGAAVGDYPPIVHRNSTTGKGVDALGNLVMPGKP